MPLVLLLEFDTTCLSSPHNIFTSGYFRLQLRPFQGLTSDDLTFIVRLFVLDLRHQFLVVTPPNSHDFTSRSRVTTLNTRFHVFRGHRHLRRAVGGKHPSSRRNFPKQTFLTRFVTGVVSLCKTVKEHRDPPFYSHRAWTFYFSRHLYGLHFETFWRRYNYNPSKETTENYDENRTRGFEVTDKRMDYGTRVSFRAS